MKQNTTIGWFVLALCSLTIIIVYTIPTLMLPVLFAEMAAELELDILQIGVAWGSLSLSSMVIGLFGGAIGDRFGSRRTLSVVCLLTGIFGALRGLVPNYGLLIVSFLIYGLVAPSLPPNLHKAGAYFFPKRRGVATGTISLAFAFALFIGSRYTATWLSPLVGGWRNVLFFFGAMGVIASVIWWLMPDDWLPPPVHSDQPFFGGIFETLGHVLRVRELWIIGSASTLFWACYRGFSGYTPVYLRELGWDAVSADNALSTFFLASLVLALPMVYLSERIGNRRPFLIVAMLASGGGIMLMGLGNPASIPIGLVVAGLMFDAFMAIYQAEILDLKGIGAYMGSALGAAVMFREIGGFFGPPIGNWLAQFGGNVPFLFWGSLSLMAAIIFLFLPQRTVNH